VKSRAAERELVGLAGDAATGDVVMYDALSHLWL
jgi:hypothetical protein